MQKWAWPCFLGGPYLENPCELKPKILFVFIMHVKVHTQFFKPKSELVTGKIPELWLSSYGMTHLCVHGMCLFVYTHVFVCASMHVFVCHACVCVCACMCLFVYTHVFVYLCVHTCRASDFPLSPENR